MVDIIPDAVTGICGVDVGCEWCKVFSHVRRKNFQEVNVYKVNQG